MLVVMLILLMVTATATFAIHATASEIRAAGYTRMSMQTSYIGETALVGAMDWVDRVGPRVLVDVMDFHRNSGRPPLDLRPFEPLMLPDQVAHRLYLEDLQMLPVGVSAPVETGSFDPSVVPTDVFGRGNAYRPVVLVDVYDVHVYTGVMAGFSASGGGGSNIRHLRATYTARGRARLATEPSGDTALINALHESAGDARAQGVSGPFAM